MKKFAVASAILAAALSTSGCFHSKKDISSYLANAERYKQAGDITKAIVELRTAVNLQPGDPTANLALAKAEDEAGDVQSAFPHYLRAAAPDFHLIEPQLRIVQILVDSERYADAAGRINATLGAFPGNPDALALRADLEDRQGQVTAAQVDADAAFGKDKANARAIAVLATLKLRANDGNGAIGILDRGLEQHPNDLRLLQVRAAAFLTLQQPDKAIDVLQTIARAAPQNVAIQLAMANVEAREGRLDSAIANFRTAVNANPSNEDMQLAFVKFLASQNKAGDVVSFLHNLIAANPRTSNYDLLLAEYLRNQGRMADAVTVLDGAAARLKEGKDFRSIQVARAKLDVSADRIEAASKRVDEVLVADPQDESALLLRATLYEQNGRLQAAVDDFLKVVRINPANARAFALLATAYLGLDQPKMAVDAMQRSVAVAPNDIVVQASLAQFMQRAGQINASRELITRLTLQYPNSVAVWVVNGQLAILRKDWAAVSRTLARMREIPGASMAVLTLDAQMKAAQGDVAAAVKSFQDAIASDPKLEAGVVGSYAKAAVAAGKAANAADFLEAKVASLPDTVRQQTWAAIMTLNADAERFEKSDAAFQAAVRLTPRDVELYQGYTRILSAQKRWADASRVVAAGLAAGCPPGPMSLLSGSIKEQSGDIAGAVAAYKRALDDNPLSVDAANNYASLLADLRPKNTEELQAARIGLSGLETGGNPYILDTIAWLDYRLGQYDEAKQLLTEAKAAQSSNPQIRFHLAAVLMASGDRTNGLALLDTLKGLTFPGSDEVRKLSET